MNPSGSWLPPDLMIEAMFLASSLVLVLLVYPARTKIMIKPYPRSDRDLTQEKPFALQLALKMAALALLLIGMALLFENSLTTLLFVLADVFLGVAFAVEMSEFLAKPVISVKKEQSL